MIVPVRLKPVQKIRTRLDNLALKLPLPKINPNALSFLSVVFSLIFWFASKNEDKLWSTGIAIACLIIIIMLDWLDGLVAKKYKSASKFGWLVDVFADRLSEGILFLSFIFPWFYLFVLNVVLSIISYRTKVHFILPLRIIFLIYFLIYSLL